MKKKSRKELNTSSINERKVAKTNSRVISGTGKRIMMTVITDCHNGQWNWSDLGERARPGRDRASVMRSQRSGQSGHFKRITDDAVGETVQSSAQTLVSGSIVSKQVCIWSFGIALNKTKYQKTKILGKTATSTLDYHYAARFIVISNSLVLVCMSECSARTKFIKLPRINFDYLQDLGAQKQVSKHYSAIFFGKHVRIKENDRFGSKILCDGLSATPR